MINKNFLLGLGFDANDGHKRITRGKNFYIFGGSKTTHQVIQENCIKFNEELKKRDKYSDGWVKKETLVKLMSSRVHGWDKSKETTRSRIEKMITNLEFIKEKTVEEDGRKIKYVRKP